MVCRPTVTKTYCPKDIIILIPGGCEFVKVPLQKGIKIANGIKVAKSATNPLKLGVYPELFGWAPYKHRKFRSRRMGRRGQSDAV